MARYNNYDDKDRSFSLSNEIYTLRRKGLLDEAKQRAEEILELDKANQDVRKAYAWTLIDICKKEQQRGNIGNAQKIADNLSYLSKSFFSEQSDEFTETLVKSIQVLKLTVNPFYFKIQEAKRLSQNGSNDKAFGIITQLTTTNNLPEEAHEIYGWIIYRYLRDHIMQLDSEQVRTQLREYINLHNERPSILHSQILNFALNYSKQDSNFRLVSFFRLWDPNNLRASDFNDSVGNEGKTIPSLMSRIARTIVDYSLTEIQEFVELLPQRKEDFLEMLKCQFFWKIYRNIEGDGNSVWGLFDQYIELFFNSSSSVFHSKVLGLAERIMKGNNVWRFYEFFKRWNPEKLRSEDWQEEKVNDEVVYKPLAVRALKRVRESVESLSDEQIGDFQWLIDLYSTAIDKIPDDDWNIRSKALLHLRVGQQTEAKCIYKSLCKKMGDKYYIWSEFADCCEDINVKIALLCKALSIEHNDDFTGKIRLELARQLIKSDKYENAAIELELYKKHYLEKGWHITSEVEKLLEQCSLSVSVPYNNSDLYAENIPIADEYAYSDIPFTEVALVDEWERSDGKIIMNFVDGKTVEFTINKKRFTVLKDSHKGQVWKFRLYKEEIINTNSNEYLWLFSGIEKFIKYIPLTVIPSTTADWGCLPVKYGYVQYVNTEKKVYHIYSTDSMLVFEHYERQEFKKGDFIKFRQYTKKIKDENKIFLCNINKCDEEEAVKHFKCMIAAVDDVSDKRQLFHFVLGPTQNSGILHYNQTDIRPSVGDFIKIYFFIRKINDKKNHDKQVKIVEVLKAETTNEINKDLIKYISGYLELKYRDVYEYVYEDMDEDIDEDMDEDIDEDMDEDIDEDMDEDMDEGMDEEKKPDFAFIENYYVHKDILEKYNINSNCYVKAKAVYAGGGKWKIYEIEKQSLSFPDIVSRL